MRELYVLPLPVQKSGNCKIDADNNSEAFERFNTVAVCNQLQQQQPIESRRKMIALSR
jgi:hypothetical protein